MARPRPTILLTGFGPFPGTPDNVSGGLIPELAARAARRFRGHHVIGEVLPTEWQRASHRLAELYAEYHPRVALHFGVSERTTGFAIETTAVNHCKSTPDAGGFLPSSTEIEANGPLSMATRLPVRTILDRLTALNIPVQLSTDAGDYLCNCIFYGSLRHASTTSPPAIAGFIHIPKSLGPDALVPDGQVQLAATRPMDWNVALLGSLEITRACLGLAPRLKASTVLSGNSAGSASMRSHN